MLTLFFLAPAQKLQDQIDADVKSAAAIQTANSVRAFRLSTAIGQTARQIVGQAVEQTSEQTSRQVEEQETWEHNRNSDTYTCLTGPNQGVCRNTPPTDVWIYSPEGWDFSGSIKNWSLWESSTQTWRFP
jgi:hypothetical protein